MSNRTILAILLILLVNVVITFAFEAYFSKPPLSEKIELSAGYHGEFYIHIPMAQTYSIEIDFYRDGKEYEYLKKVLGPMTGGGDNGLPMRLEWSLFKDSELIDSHVSTSDDSCAWSNATVSRCFGRIKHSRGNYRLVVNVPEISSELEDFSTDITINYNFKNAHTWQTGYIIYSLLFSVFIAPIIGVILVSILLYRYYKKHLTRQATGQ